MRVSIGRRNRSRRVQVSRRPALILGVTVAAILALLVPVASASWWSGGKFRVWKPRIAAPATTTTTTRPATTTTTRPATTTTTTRPATTTTTTTTTTPPFSTS